MKKLIAYLFFILFFVTSIFAQDAKIDTMKIYTIVEQMPKFPGCEEIGGTNMQKDSCTQQYLLDYMYRSIQYPDEAREKGVEGQAVIRFVVERDGSIGEATIAKNPGAGCGEEALRVLTSMNEVDYKWTPGKIKGETVRVAMTMPVKFKLEEPQAFVITEQNDTIWTQFDTPLTFQGGDEALIKYVTENTNFPEEYKDSCQAGVIQATIMVRRTGEVEILETFDFNSLGMDFQFEAIRTAMGSAGKWTAATYKGKAVNSSFPLRISFRPKSGGCVTNLSNFEKSVKFADDANNLYNEQKLDESLSKISDAIRLQPNNCEYLYLRGNIYMNQGKKAEACSDLTRVKETLAVTWVDSLLPLLCAPVPTEDKPEGGK